MALLLALLLLFSFLTPELALSVSPFNRSSFPADFFFGAASSAYQYEGAAFEGGKGPSIWDTFTHKYPDKIEDGSNGDIAENFYHLYKDDVKLIKHTGLNTFRFSIAWSRILPRGNLSGGVNREGIDFYNSLINELLSNGITPFVTIFHWDTPQALEDEYEGFLSSRIVDDFVDYANICFKEFGDRVKHWITMNEPYIYTVFGYDMGSMAPGRCSSWRNNCPAGDSATEPYTVAHHMLLSHAATVKLYKSKYQAVQKGEIGITVIASWLEPYNPKSKLDIKATQRSFDFSYGWYLHPLVYGDYPKTMRSIVGKRLPIFNQTQSMMVKGSYDFIGVNYYTARYVSNVVSNNGINASYTTDSYSHLTTERNGKPIGEETASPGFNIYAKGLRDILVYTKDRYNNPTIYITENGMSDPQNLTVKEGIKDDKRIKYHNDHLAAVKEAMDKHGVKVKGYLAWSFLDTFEWSSGYTVRFGLCYIDYKNDLKRHLKDSALWFKESLSRM